MSRLFTEFRVIYIVVVFGGKGSHHAMPCHAMSYSILCYLWLLWLRMLKKKKKKKKKKQNYSFLSVSFSFFDLRIDSFSPPPVTICFCLNPQVGHQRRAALYKAG